MQRSTNPPGTLFEAMLTVVSLPTSCLSVCPVLSACMSVGPSVCLSFLSCP